MLCSYYFICI